MEHGTNCHLSSCLQLSFLPLSCPFCRRLFCESHFLPAQHTCQAPGAKDSASVLTSAELTKRVLRANTEGDSLGSSRLPCQKRGCKAHSLEVHNASSTEQYRQSVQHKAPTCHRCSGLFCSSHRSPTHHDCSAPEPPSEGQQRMAAAEERKRKARELIAMKFPNKGK
ncbi:unnamed protein product [Parajaminaea phylloscopi]